MRRVGGFFISQPPGVQHKTTVFVLSGRGMVGRPFGKHLPTARLVAFRPPSRLTFPSFLRVEGTTLLRHLQGETCRCVESVLLLVYLHYEFDSISAYIQTSKGSASSTGGRIESVSSSRTGTKRSVNEATRLALQLTRPPSTVQLRLRPRVDLLCGRNPIGAHSD